MKNKNQNLVNNKSGFTLAEVVIVLVVFSILAFLGPIPFFQSKKLAHENVMHNSVRLAVQNYLSQLNEVEFDALHQAVADQNNIPLPVKNLSSNKSSGMQLSDRLFLNRVNHKSVPVVAEKNYSGEYENLTMELLVTPTVNQFTDPDGREVLEFTLEYQYETNFKGFKGTHGGLKTFTRTSQEL